MMHLADINGRQYERRRESDRRQIRFAAIAAGVLLGLGVAAIVIAMGRALP